MKTCSCLVLQHNVLGATVTSNEEPERTQTLHVWFDPSFLSVYLTAL
jgi:hypothetical protein